MIDWPQHPSELLDIIWRIAAVQHRVTVRTDRNQIKFRVHGIRGPQTAQRPHVVDVNEALARVAVPLLETQVANRASQTVIIDAGVARFRISLVAIHRHSLDIPFLVAILLGQLADCCWLIGWGKARKSWTGKRRQSGLGLVMLILGEQVPKSFIQYEVLNTEVCAACLDHPIKSPAWGSRCEKLLGIWKSSVCPDSREETPGPGAGGIAGPAIQAHHLIVKVGFRSQFRVLPRISSVRRRAPPLLLS